MRRLPSRRVLLAATLLLPLLILASVWGNGHRVAQQGQEWLIPIKGYDPRDLLRGHFIQYRYDWPVDGANDGRGTPFAPSSYAGSACIEGVAPDIRHVREIPARTPAAEARAGGCAIVARASFGTREEIRGLETGILFTSQARALALSRGLADPALQALVRVRIRPDGVMRPVDLAFRPRTQAAPLVPTAAPVRPSPR